VFVLQVDVDNLSTRQFWEKKKMNQFCIGPFRRLIRSSPSLSCISIFLYSQVSSSSIVGSLILLASVIF